jgi:hypothetical protein
MHGQHRRIVCLLFGVCTSNLFFFIVGVFYDLFGYFRLNGTTKKIHLGQNRNLAMHFNDCHVDLSAFLLYWYPLFTS